MIFSVAATEERYEKMKKTMSVFLTAVLFFMAVPDLTFAGVTDADIPAGSKGGKWEIRLGTGYAAAPTPPLLHGGYLYVGAGKKLYKINRETGSILKSSNTLAGNMGYAMFPPVYGNGMIFIGVGNGRIQALDAKTLSVKWTCIARTGATNSPVVFDGDSRSVFFATWNNKNEGGEYICLDADDGSFRWAVEHKDGFYWSGAYVGSDHVIFGSESVYGTQNSTIYSVDKRTGAIISTMGAIGNIRSTVTGDENSVYVLTQNSRLYKINIGSGGSFVSSSYVAVSGGSTGAPTILDGKIYFGTSAKTIDVYSLSDLKKIDSFHMPGYPQSEFLLEKNPDGSVDIYSTYNSYPGGICRIDGKSKVADNNFFVPANGQFCTSPLVCDGNGVIYYKNDSCYLMAVDVPGKITGVKPAVKINSYNSLKISWKKMSGASGYDIYRSAGSTDSYKKIRSLTSAATSFNDTGLKTGEKYYYRLQAKYKGEGGSTEFSRMSSAAYASPNLNKTSIKTTAGKKQIKLSWKKVYGASGYVIYRATKKNGKYKKVKIIKKSSVRSWTNKKLKSKRKYFYKVKAYRITGSKKAYSAFSNISYKKVK